MSRIEKSITVDAPIDMVYGQWTRFESFPDFMEGVVRVIQVDDRTLDWTTSATGRTRTWQTRITDQTPLERIAWKSIEGTQNDGCVMFLPTSPTRTEVRLVVDADPEGLVEEIGDEAGSLDHRVGGDLDRFKDLMEGRSAPTCPWQGDIHGDDADPGGARSIAPNHHSVNRADEGHGHG